ncbi:hypothetical protein BHM03_00026522 [Ensete ventricosum]|uniref:DUF834 domain-containing protein n=1 Tax=Ensete ventricosum TaxID=4639 RepID=A0A445MHD9_ENSVE|nr:hypothetical protein BHM03_00026522 [Ensete ventricosum]
MAKEGGNRRVKGEDGNRGRSRAWLGWEANDNDVAVRGQRLGDDREELCTVEDGRRQRRKVAKEGDGSRGGSRAWLEREAAAVTLLCTTEG